jgi:glycosyltransferase involved in cell wall biosynthesis
LPVILRHAFPNGWGVKLLHLVANLDRINYGVWHTVVATWPYLQEFSGLECRLGYLDTGSAVPPELSHHRLHPLSGNTDRDLAGLGDLIAASDRTLVISHGLWSYPSRLASLLRQKGVAWLAVPHGMLEPWGMRHKWLKKQLYFHLFEKKRLQRADALLAVGKPEHRNLQRTFRAVWHIPNGIEPFTGKTQKGQQCLEYLFLGRLHRKKGVAPLVRAWIDSGLGFSDACRLRIAGPDEGELRSVQRMMNSSAVRNVVIEGPVFGERKLQLLQQAHFFVLPSMSEGFPTSVLEGMTFGCIPLISRGCNFPEALEEGVALELAPESGAISRRLQETAAMPSSELQAISARSKEFADRQYNLRSVAMRQYELYRRLLNEGGEYLA